MPLLGRGAPAGSTGQSRSANGVTYTLERKRVKNINLRLRADGSVWASAAPRVPAAAVDAFVAGRAGWIRRQQAALAARAGARTAEVLPAPDEALALFNAVSARIFPLFARQLNGQPPELRVRAMTSRWGVCHPARRRITLALQLAAKPPELVEYVVLHEYCHFVHPNHGPAFWALLEGYMPDARARRRALRGG